MTIVHLGPALGPAGEHLLADQLTSALGHLLTVRDLGLPLQPAVAERDAGTAWIAEATLTLEHLEGSPEIYVCVQTPADPKGKPLREAEPLAKIVRESPVFKRTNTSFRLGPIWELRVSREPCAPGLDGGLVDAAVVD